MVSELLPLVSFEHWLDTTPDYQGAFGIALPKTEADLASYFTEMGFAAFIELGEATGCVRWKPWTRAETRGEVDHEAFVEEVVDLLHFVANMCAAVGVSDAELSEVYNAKRMINLARITSGTYDGRLAGK